MRKELVGLPGDAWAERMRGGRTEGRRYICMSCTVILEDLDSAGIGKMNASLITRSRRVWRTLRCVRLASVSSRKLVRYDDADVRSTADIAVDRE